MIENADLFSWMIWEFRGRKICLSLLLVWWEPIGPLIQSSSICDCDMWVGVYGLDSFWGNHDRLVRDGQWLDCKLRVLAFARDLCFLGRGERAMEAGAKTYNNQCESMIWGWWWCVEAFEKSGLLDAKRLCARDREKKWDESSWFRLGREKRDEAHTI